MTTEAILAAIDAEIERLQNVRDLLTETTKGKGNTAAPRKRRTLTAAARKRIADAQRKRWAKARRETK